jgi:raffinose/stachyose/melibiose transport system permease protein
MKQKPMTAGSAMLYIFLVGYLAISLYPLIWMLFYSFKNNQEIFVSNPFGFPQTLRWENYEKAWSQYDVVSYFFNSVIITALTVVCTIGVSLLFSYGTARIPWRLSKVARTYVTAGMFIPIQIILIPLLIMIRELRLANSYWSLVAPYTASQIPFASLVFFGFLRTLPSEFEAAAAIDGAGSWRTFLSIIAPNVVAPIAAVTIFVFMFAWNEFLMALILISNESMKTLPLGLLKFQGRFHTDWGAMGAALVIASFPAILMYLLLSDRVQNAFTSAGSLK